MKILDKQIVMESFVEEVDYCINVNGYISLDVLNKYVRNINELEQLQNNWNELKKWLEEESNNTIYATGHLTAICMTLNKMQELEEEKDERG